MTRFLILAALAVALAASPAAARCFKFQRDCGASSSTPKTYPITNTHRQRTGDIYDPGHGRNIQIRDNYRRILGFIERDGTVINTHRQPVGSIENLGGLR